LLEACGISPTLPGGEPDPGLIATSSDPRATTDAFVAAIARHRHFARETDPPRV
jgi:catalase